MQSQRGGGGGGRSEGLPGQVWNVGGGVGPQACSSYLRRGWVPPSPQDPPPLPTPFPLSGAHSSVSCLPRSGPSPPTPGFGATLLLQACLLDTVSFPGWARALNFAWPVDAKGVLLGTPFGSRQDVLAAGATSPDLEQSGTMRPCGRAGFAGGTSMEGPLPARTQWLKVTGHPLRGEA